MLNINKICVSKIVLVIAILVLLGNAAAISRDYQDGWILQGLEIPFLFFVITYFVAFSSEKRKSWLVALAIIGRTVFLLIPNFKYVWFQGKAIDQHIQYALANHVYNEGYIAPSGISVYTDTPFIHLIFSTFSLVLNIPISDSLKYIPVCLSPIFPLCTYIIIKRLNFIQGTTALKYALFVSSIPITSEKYIVSGAQFGVLLSFLVLTSLIMLMKNNDSRYSIILIVLVSTLAMTHSSSSILLTTFLILLMLLQKIPYFKLKGYLKSSTTLMITLVSTTWLMFAAKTTLEAVTKVLFIKTVIGTTPTSSYIPNRFFELLSVNIWEATKAILVFNGAEIFLLLLTLFGLIAMVKMKKQVTSRFFFLIGGLIILFIPIGLLLRVGGFRALHLVSPLFPIFTAIFIIRTNKTKVAIGAIVFSLMVLLATLQLYNCQPLIPSSDVLSKDLPSSEPLVYVTGVNSIYQRQMIEFAWVHVDGRIAGDRVTQHQIVSLTELDFSMNHLIGYYPLDKNSPERTYNFFLIHLPGISGPFAEQAEMRTSNSILLAIYESNIVYTNGESYILTS